MRDKSGSAAWLSNRNKLFSGPRWAGLGRGSLLLGFRNLGLKPKPYTLVCEFDDTAHTLIPRPDRSCNKVSHADRVQGLPPRSPGNAACLLKGQTGSAVPGDTWPAHPETSQDPDRLELNSSLAIPTCSKYCLLKQMLCRSCPQEAQAEQGQCTLPAQRPGGISSTGRHSGGRGTLCQAAALRPGPQALQVSIVCLCFCSGQPKSSCSIF